MPEFLPGKYERWHNAKHCLRSEIVLADIHVEKYDPKFEKQWDEFVERKSYNGTFLQTRRFLNYHAEGKFEDASLIIFKGTSTTIMAVVPACVKHENDEKVFYSHLGSTFGGVIIDERFYNVTKVEIILNALEDYLIQNGYSRIHLKQSPQILSKKNNDLLEYFFAQRGYRRISELSSVIDFSVYEDNVISNFDSDRRRVYRKSLTFGMTFSELETPEEILEFYELLKLNLEKHNAKPVHTYEELMDFKYKRLKENVNFYGVFHEGRMVAGSMVFLFKNMVFHTQYLAAAQDALELFPNHFQNTNLIMAAKEKGYRYFSFGISTEEKGKILNKQLATFKEGFGSIYSNNNSFTKGLK